MNTLPLRYLKWMARDVALGPVIGMALLGGIAAFTEVPINGELMFGVRRVGLVFVLLATAGIVSGDLAGGYYRTLFARPVSPWAYYLQRWLVGAVAVLLLVSLMDLAVAIRLHVPMVGADLLARAALAYLLVGGLVLLLSTVTRRDWLVAALLMLGHGALGQVLAAGLWQNRAADLVYQALPPFQFIGLAKPVTWGHELAHAALYGVGLLAAALLVLHQRPLGGRMEA